MPRHIILLVGMMLSGKTTVGRRLAERLGWPFVDLDAEIARRTRRSIPDWFALGEPAFRAVERETLASLLSQPGQRVIAAGGGAVESPASRQRCRKGALVVYLEASPDELVARHTGPSGRPLLDDAPDPRARLAELLLRREPLYRAVQHVTVPVGRLEPEVVVETILRAHAEHAHD